MTKSKKYIVEFVGEKAVTVTDYESLLHASLGAGIPHFHVCGGNAKCSTCRVLILENSRYLTAPTSKEILLKNQMRFPPNVRLACQTHVRGSLVKIKRIIQDETDIGLYVGSAAGDSTQQLGEESEMALLFLDIRNFTLIVETHPAFDVIHIIRKLFSSFQYSIEHNSGRIIETTGDGIYAVFKSGLKKEHDAKSAVSAAHSLIENLNTLNENYFAPYFREKIRIGVGIHVGQVVSGSVLVGTDTHPVTMGYPVNVASRLQNATKDLNNDIIVSADTYNLLIDPPGFESATITVKGISQPLKVYLMGKPYTVT